jgi:opacity protein-like surface antigen
MKRVLVAAMILCLLPTAALAQDWWEDDFDEKEYPPISLELNAWVSSINGNVRWWNLETARQGTELDFDEDLGLTSSSVGPYIRLDIGLDDRWDLRLAFWHTSFDKTDELDNSVKFDRAIFSSGVETQRKFSLDSYSALVGYKFMDGSQLDLSVLFGAGAYKANMEMETDTMLSEQDALVPTPLVGVELYIDLTENIVVRGQVHGMALSVSDTIGEAVDAEAAVSWTLAEGLYVTGGYKLFRTDVEFEDEEGSDFPNKGDFDIEGPYFGLGIVF